jgi:hypothetical protein
MLNLFMGQQPSQVVNDALQMNCVEPHAGAERWTNLSAYYKARVDSGNGERDSHGAGAINNR